MGANIMGAVLSVLYAARNGLMDGEVICEIDEVEVVPSCLVVGAAWDARGSGAGKERETSARFSEHDLEKRQPNFVTLGGISAIHNSRTCRHTAFQVWGAAEINLGYELSEDHKRVLLLVLKVREIFVIEAPDRGAALLPPKSQQCREYWTTSLHAHTRSRLGQNVTKAAR